MGSPLCYEFSITSVEHSQPKSQLKRDYQPTAPGSHREDEPQRHEDTKESVWAGHTARMSFKPNRCRAGHRRRELPPQINYAPHKAAFILKEMTDALFEGN